jgi:hypothetical protein
LKIKDGSLFALKLGLPILQIILELEKCQGNISKKKSKPFLRLFHKLHRKVQAASCV